MGSTLGFSRKISKPQINKQQHNFPSVDMRQSFRQSYDIDLLNKKKIINANNEADQVFRTTKNQVSEVERYIPVSLPQTYQVSSEFNNIMIQSKNLSSKSTIKKSSKINDYEFLEWQYPGQHSDIQIIIDQQFQFNPANEIFNTVMFSYLHYASTIQNTIIAPDKFKTIQQEGKKLRYLCKLLINGCYRSVQCLSRQNNWIKLLESAVDFIFIRQTTFAQLCYCLFGWIPMSYNLEDVEDKDQIFYALDGDFKRGNLIASIQTNDFSFSILEFISLQNNDKYLLGRLGAYKQQISEYIDVCMPKLLKDKVIKQKNIYVFDWDLLIKQKSKIMFALKPQFLPHKIQFNGSWQFKDFGKFSDLDFSLYYQDQYILKLQPHQFDLEIKFLLNIHSSQFTQKSQNYPKICLFPFDGNRVVYLRQQIQANHQSLIGDFYTSIHIIPQSKVDQYYTLVIFNNQTQYNYTLNVYSSEKVFLGKNFISQKQQTVIEGIFDEDNIGQNIFSPSFLNNPIYLLNIKQSTDLEIFLEANSKDFKLTNLLIQLNQQVQPQSIRAFISEYYSDFIDNYYSSGFYYPSVSYSRIKISKPTKLLYIPLGYQSQIMTQYKVKILANNSQKVKITPAKWVLFQHSFSATSTHQPDFTQKNPTWQGVFEITQDMIKRNRVYYFNFTSKIQAIFKLVSLSYERTYNYGNQQQIGQVYYKQPDLSLYICKVKKVQGRFLARVHTKTHFSKCPSGLRTYILSLEQDPQILFWSVVIMLDYFQHSSQVQYQLSLNSNKKITFGKLTHEILKNL